MLLERASPPEAAPSGAAAQPAQVDQVAPPCGQEKTAGQVGTESDFTIAVRILVLSPDALRQVKRLLVSMHLWPHSDAGAACAASAKLTEGSGSTAGSLTPHGEGPRSWSTGGKKSRQQQHGARTGKRAEESERSSSAIAVNDSGSAGSEIDADCSYTAADSHAETWDEKSNAGKKSCGGQGGTCVEEPIDVQKSKESCDGALANSRLAGGPGSGRDRLAPSSASCARQVPGCSAARRGCDGWTKANEPDGSRHSGSLEGCGASGAGSGSGQPFALQRSAETSGDSAAEGSSDDSVNENGQGRSECDASGSNSDDLSAHEMRCLPRDTVVWVDGEDAPREVSELTRGSRVLCFDSLARNVRYVEVLQVREDQDPVDWLAIELADGTRTVVAADHPVKLADAPVLQSVVRARDIVPQASRIMVHRVTTNSVEVSSVSAVPPELSPASRHVSVTVQQSNRNAILVASAEQSHGDVRAMAVGSANLFPPPVEIIRTFLHGKTPLASSRKAARRSSSWPRISHSLLDGPECALPEATLPAPLLAPPQASFPFSDKTSTSESAQDTTTSDASSDGETLVVLPWILPGQAGRNAMHAGQAPGSLVALMRAQLEGLPSMGSDAHPTCNPCYFAHRGRCSAGIWCPRCHQPHMKCKGKLRPLLR